MEAKVAKIESDVAHVREDIATIWGDLTALRATLGKVKDDLAPVKTDLARLAGSIKADLVTMTWADRLLSRRFQLCPSGANCIAKPSRNTCSRKPFSSASIVPSQSG